MYSSDLGFLSMSCGTAIACSLALMLFCASGPMKNARSLFLESTIALRIHFPVPNINKVWSLWYNVLNASKGHLMDKNKLITPNSVIASWPSGFTKNGYVLCKMKVTYFIVSPKGAFQEQWWSKSITFSYYNTQLSNNYNANYYY